MTGGRPKLEDIDDMDAEAERLLNEYGSDGVTVAGLAERHGLSKYQVSRRLERARRNRSAGECETCGRRL